MNNLDNILKQQMEAFAPDAPNVWSGIAQGVQANAAAQTANVAKTIGSKLVITIAKIAAIVVIPASVIVYFVSNEKNNIVESPKVENSILSPNHNTEELKTVESPKTATVNTENKSLIISESKRGISNNNSNLNSSKNIVSETIIINKLNTTEQINNSNKAKNEKVIIVSNETNNAKLYEETAENKEVEIIEENEIKEDFLNSENEIRIKAFPNVFTPNNDGINDKYIIDLEGEKFYNLKIYNYNNELVFESNDKNNNWDGINYKNGQVCNSGTYYGIFEFKLTNEDKNSTRMTKIKLIR
ncbi:MAG: gliding motility-associated C-terminal domain-containing protein [Bacteroidia bacterium]|nr:gliding motility-associated C-terminal domain-containing protein [Bacteroidia bacterium]